MALHPQTQAILDGMARFGWKDFHLLTPAEARVQMGALRAKDPPEPIAQVEDRTIPGPRGEIPVRIYRPAQARGALAYFHGGGWVVGDLDGHDAPCRALANRAGCVVVSVDYRMAPEHTYPAAAGDCYAATGWVAANAAGLGAAGGKVAVGGDSAGGNLAAVVAQMARDNGGPALAFQLLVYPVTDYDLESGSYQANAEGFLLSRAAMRWFWELYVPREEMRRAPYASPLRTSSFAGLPPALVVTAEYDPLRDEGEAYAARLAEAGVPATLRRYDGQIHGFFTMANVLDDAKAAQAEAAAMLKAALA